MKAIVASLICSLIGSQANADWQYTRWGMTLDEVMAAGSPQVERYVRTNRSSDAEETLASAPYIGAGISFVSYFRFSRSTGRLSSVAVEANNQGDCASLVPALKAKYGSGKQTIDEMIEIYGWVDAKSANRIALTYGKMPGMPCAIKYMPYSGAPEPKPRSGGL